MDRMSDGDHDPLLVHDHCGRDAFDVVRVARGLTQAVQSHPPMDRRSFQERGHNLLVLVSDGEKSDGFVSERVHQIVPVRN